MINCYQKAVLFKEAWQLEREVTPLEGKDGGAAILTGCHVLSMQVGHTVLNMAFVVSF